ncbi:MAG: MarR family transcriptional regulator [Rhodospirillaceae bacterium]|nr:MarR family transcriptional regulator [Rhodospirillaceae bacterium]
MPNLERSIGFLVNDVARLFRRNFNRRAETLGLSQSQWRTLAYLSRQEGVNQATLAERLEIQPITLVRLIDRLQEAGLVARHPDPKDRRAVRLHLTPEAQPLLTEMWALAAITREDALNGLSDAERETLTDLLARIRQNLFDTERRSVAEPTQEESNANAASRV